MTDPAALVRAYYRALDDGEYDRLDSLLAPSFSQERPDRRFASRAAFVRFMREERPVTGTRHDLDGVVVDGERAVAEGTLIGPDGEPMFRFADVFDLEDGRLVTLRTYTDSHDEVGIDGG